MKFRKHTCFICGKPIKGPLVNTIEENPPLPVHKKCKEEHLAKSK